MWASSKSGILSSTLSLVKNALESQDISPSQANEPILPGSRFLQEEIDKNIEAMWTALNTLRSQISRAATQRNSLSPISQLPSEIMIGIFHIALESRKLDPEDFSYYERIQTLAAVSTVWRNIITQTPSFWTKVEISESVNTSPLAISLERAGDMPLDIGCSADKLSRWRFHGREESARLKPAYDAMRAARTHLPRWRSFYLATRCPVTAQELLSVKAFNIERVQVSFDWERRSQDWEEPATLFNGDTRKLKEVIIEGMPLCWTSNHLTGLRVLDLREIRYDGWSPSVATILHTLENCPELEELCLVSCDVTSASEGQDLNISDQTIDLPNLQSIVLVQVSSLVTNSILQSLRASTLSLLHLCPYLTTQSLPISLTPHIKAIQRTIIAADDFEVSIYGQSFYLSAVRGETRSLQLEVTLDPELQEQAELLLWLADNTPLPKLATRADVSLAHCPELLREFHDALYRWVPSATSLTLDCGSQPRFMLQRLSESVQAPGGGASWLWPNLQSLCVTDPEIIGKEVLAFLQGRTPPSESDQSPPSKSSTLGDDSSVEANTKPIKLSKLHIDVVDVGDHGTLDAICELVGKERVTWCKTIGEEVEAPDLEPYSVTL
ncbi:hypothetical protein FRC01_000517 [Tulasnella sp. 417]|nr:hypothetical protein FRC01_000517 [Tulasnella sp. 417]